MAENIHPSQVHPGDAFDDRAAVRAAGIHLVLQAGIDYRVGSPAHSIVLNEGYIDDQDDGIEIIYTGHGGNKNGRQVADQKWELGNLAMYRAWAAGSVVWITRGPKLKRTPFPTGGKYIYGGAFRVVDAFREEGRDGFLICRFRMVQVDGLEPEESLLLPEPSAEAVRRIEATVQRLVRNSQLVRDVKSIHANTCQFCGVPIELPHNTQYSEGAHIKPLGKPHNGPDALSNLLCLCPNDHVRFDGGSIIVTETLEVVDTVRDWRAQLRLDPRHAVSSEFLAYHREIFM